MACVALGFITVKQDQQDIGKIHPAIAWPDRVAMGIFTVPAKSQELLLEIMGDSTAETRVLYADRGRPLQIFVGTLKPGYRVNREGPFDEHQLVGGIPQAMQVMEAVVQLATRNFPEWGRAADQVLHDIPEV